jgi:hypothetical protein
MSRSSTLDDEILSEFQRYYRNSFDYKTFQKHKAEYLLCLKTHCYPQTPDMYLRDVQFNLVRADFCAADCSRTMNAIKSQQMQSMSEVCHKNRECLTLQKKDQLKCKQEAF